MPQPFVAKEGGMEDTINQKYTNELSELMNVEQGE